MLFNNYLFELLKNKHLQVPDALLDLGFSESYSYQLLNGTRNPSRDTVLKIAFGLNADLMDANILLQLSGHNLLYVRDKRDALIYYAFLNNMTITDLNQLLIEKNLTYL